MALNESDANELLKCSRRRDGLVPAKGSLKGRHVSLATDH